MKKKIINIILIVVVIISTILATLILTDNEQETKEEKSILTVWSDDEDISYLFDEVYGEDFEYELNWVNVSNEEMGDKIQLHLALHEPIADICILYRNSLSSINPDTTFIDLEERFQLNPDDLFNINNKALINDKGHLWAVPSTLSAAGMAYNKKLMMDYFGLENPIQVRYEFNSWADLISKGKEVKKNNPNIKMFSSLSDAAVILIGQTKQEFVVDNKLNEASRFKNFFTILKALQDEGLVGDNQMFSPSWYKSLKSDEILFFPKWNI